MKVFVKSLENYIKWCTYLCIQPIWSSAEAISKEKKLLFVSLYFLISGEASNIRFLPECLCYIFHHMVRELDEILRQQAAQPANSCRSENGVSFLDQVIFPVYEVVAAGNDNCEVMTYCSQELRLRAIARKGIGKDHAKWSPTVTVTGAIKT